MKRLYKLQIALLAGGLVASVACRAQLGLMETSVVNLNVTDGSEPQGELVEGNDGLLYGTASQGGAFGQGAIFKATLDGSLTTLFSFNGTNGASPWFGPVQTADGTLYGMTAAGGNGFQGGAAGQGTIYQLCTNGVLNTLVAFGGTNGLEPISLMLGGDGDLYGATLLGGAFTNEPNDHYAGDGTAFKVTTNGQFTLLASFDGTNGEGPRALLQGNDGNFYGVTDLGGACGYGTVFQMTTNGEVTTLFSFDGTNGMEPDTLMQGSDGVLYGTTVFGGNGFSGGPPPGPISAPESVSGYGTVFRITTNGCFSVLGLFDSSNGEWPSGRLVEVTNGVFCGTTGYGGESRTGAEVGTLFQITTNGELTLLYTFQISEQLPMYPEGGVIKASDGNYYGVGDKGVYAIRPIQRPVLQACSQGNQINLTWNAWAGYDYSVFYRSNLTDGDVSVLSDAIAQTNGVMSFSDTVGPDAQRFYEVLLNQVQ